MYKQKLDWYKKMVIAAAATDPEVLKQHPEWWATMRQLLDNPEAAEFLASHGGNIDTIRSIVYPPAPAPKSPAAVQPDLPLRAPDPKPVDEVPPATEFEIEEEVIYMLAQVRNVDGFIDGTPLVVFTKEAYGKRLIFWVSEDGRVGMFPTNADLKNSVEILKDSDGGIIASETIMDLFDAFRSLEEEPAENDEPDGEEGEVPEGRIDSDKISEYQKNIETQFLDTKQNLVVNALSGTGKTTVLRHIASFKKPDEQWLYLVFNKKNQVEAEEKFPDGVTVLTSHSFLGGVLHNEKGNSIPDHELTPSKNRGEEMAQDALEMSAAIPRDTMLSPDMARKYPRGRVYQGARSALEDIVNLSRASALSPNDPNLRAKIGKVIEDYEIDTDIQNKEYGRLQGRPMPMKDKLIDEAMIILRDLLPGADLSRYKSVPYDYYDRGTRSYRTGRKDKSGDYAGKRDHDDTLWYSAVYSGVMSWPRFDVVLVDEVQDFNRCQQIMLKALSDVGARIVAVGDPNQSIYMFRGADINAFHSVQDIVNPESDALPLPVNYRCGKAIIDFVNKHPLSPVDDLKAGALDEEGNLLEGKVIENEDSDAAVRSVIHEYHANGDRLQMSTAFIARTNSILIDVAMELIKNDVVFKMIGIDVDKKLISLCNQTAGYGKAKRTFNMEDFVARLNDTHTRNIGKLGFSKSQLKKKEGQQRIYDTLSHIISKITQVNPDGTTIYKDGETELKTSDDLVRYLQAKFAGLKFDSENAQEVQKVRDFTKRDPHEYVALCSAHRSKGLEFERVYIMGIDQFPHFLSKGKPNSEKQEKNMFYVAATRAKNELHIPAPKPRY